MLFRKMVAGWLITATPALSQKLDVVIDVSAARAVLAAVRDPALTDAEAAQVAALPGNRGLIRKTRSYGRPGTEALFARALIAAAHHEDAYVDPGRFELVGVRDRAAATEAALDAIGDPRLHAVDDVRARIAAFTPPGLGGRVTGYLVAGGTSGGFAFGEPEFFLDLDRYPAPLIATTIMEHELFHAVQALARSAHPVPSGREACLARTPHAAEIADLTESLMQEGTATWVGDVLSLPQQGADAPTAKERASFARNVGMVSRSITQLELSVHGLASEAQVTPEEVYALGFYGDEVLYALGYEMTRAIAREQGSAAIGELIGQPGAAFIDRYVRLKSYGRDAETPALKPETVRWADRLMECSRVASSESAPRDPKSTSTT